MCFTEKVLQVVMLIDSLPKQVSQYYSKTIIAPDLTRPSSLHFLVCLLAQRVFDASLYVKSGIC